MQFIALLAFGSVWLMLRERDVIARVGIPIGLSIDAGWNDPRVLLEIGRTAYGQLVVVDEFYKSNTHVRDAIRWLDQNDKHQGTIFAEHEPSDIQKFKEAGFRAKKATKSLDAGISEVKRRLRDDGTSGTQGGMRASGSHSGRISS